MFRCRGRCRWSMAKCTAVYLAWVEHSVVSVRTVKSSVVILTWSNLAWESIALSVHHSHHHHLSLIIITAATTICQYYHHYNQHLSPIIITTTTICHYYHRSHHDLSLLSSSKNLSNNIFRMKFIYLRYMSSRNRSATMQEGKLEAREMSRLDILSNLWKKLPVYATVNGSCLLYKHCSTIISLAKILHHL